jgi:histidine ammonia-lyase
MMHSALSAISRNKILSEMTNFDNCCIDNYKKDIFYGSGLYYDKINELMDNLYYIMALEIMAALEGIKELS